MLDPQATQERMHRLLKEKYKKSWFTLWAEAWGEKSWWLKAIILFLISLVTILPAVVFQVWPLLAFTVLFAVVYMGFSLFLDNHYKAEQARLEKSQDFSSIFYTLFNRMFKSSNELVETAEEAKNCVDDLGSEVARFSDVNRTLVGQSARLDTVTTHLEEGAQAVENSQELIVEAIENQEQKNAMHAAEIKVLKGQYQQKYDDMQHEIEALKKVNTSLLIEKQRTHCVNLALVQTMGDLAKIGKDQKQDSQQYKQSMDRILKTTEEKCEQVLENLNHAQSRLEQNTEKMTELNQKFENITNGSKRLSYDPNKLFYPHNKSADINKRHSVAESIMVF